MVQPTENGQCDHPARSALRGAFRHPLRDPLVRSRRVVVSDVLGKPSTHLPLGEDEDRVQAFAAYAPDEAFAEGVRFRRSNGRLQHPRAAGLGHHVENPVELVVAVAPRSAAARTTASRCGAAALSTACWATASR